MRAHEFLFTERQVSQVSATSIPKYIANIITLLGNAENPAIRLELQLKQSTPGQGDLIPFDPDQGQSASLQGAWNLIKDDPEKHREIFDHPIIGTIVGDLDNEYNWPKGRKPQHNEKFTIKLGELSKTKDVKGSSKSWNLGNLTEGIFAAGLYLRLLKEDAITTKALTSLLLNKKLYNNRPFPYQKGLPIKYQTGESSDRISLHIGLSKNNFDALKDGPTLEGLIEHINSIAANVNNSSDLIELRDKLRINNIIDQINVRAAGTEDEKLSTVDVDIWVTNTETKETDKVKYERSVKAGEVKQFGQVTAGGAKKYGFRGEDKLISSTRDKKTNTTLMKFGDNEATLHNDKKMSHKDNRKALEMIAQRRWALQEQFWKSWSSDIDFGNTQKKFTDTWIKSLENDKDKTGYLDAYTLSYNKAADELNSLLDVGVKKDKKAVKKWLGKFFGELHTHAGKTSRPGAFTKTTHFDKGAYEELDFAELHKYIEVADLEAVVSEYKIHSDAAKKRGEGPQERARPEVHIRAKNASPEKSIVQWDQGEVFLIFRFYVAEGKLSNLIEKGDLLRKWAWVASSDKKGKRTDAMGMLIDPKPTPIKTPA
jgi:hypothetical protein|tara:strand:+ start:86 stop:1876 length:1791 start_codon:yes stop_codon:yes gene_type:complete